MRPLHIAAFAASLASAMPLAASGTLLDQGYRQMYNLEFDEAHSTFRRFHQLYPADPMGPVSDAAAYLFTEFERLNILQSELFSDDSRFLSRRTVAPDPKLKQEFEAALERSRVLAEDRLRRDPHDEDALFAEVLRLGLHSNYLAMVEKRYAPALGEMKQGRILAEQLLARNPNYYDAYLAVGIENYLLSIKPAPIRWILRIGGARTDQAQGLSNLRRTAENGRFLRAYAKLMLAVAALRDNQRGKARAMLSELTAQYPRNPLYLEELAKLR